MFSPEYLVELVAYYAVMRGYAERLFIHCFKHYSCECQTTLFYQEITDS